MNFNCELFKTTDYLLLPTTLPRRHNLISRAPYDVDRGWRLRTCLKVAWEKNQTRCGVKSVLAFFYLLKTVSSHDLLCSIWIEAIAQVRGKSWQNSSTHSSCYLPWKGSCHQCNNSFHPWMNSYLEEGATLVSAWGGGKTLACAIVSTQIREAHGCYCSLKKKKSGNAMTHFMGGGEKQTNSYTIVYMYICFYIFECTHVWIQTMGDPFQGFLMSHLGHI